MNRAILIGKIKSNLISDGGEFEYSHTFIKAVQTWIKVDNHFNHAAALKIGLEQPRKLVDAIGYLLLVARALLIANHRAYATI